MCQIFISVNDPSTFPISVQAEIKSLSLNNFYFMPNHIGTSEVEKVHVGGMLFLISHKQFSETVKPRVAYFNYPTPCPETLIRSSSLFSSPRERIWGTYPLEHTASSAGLPAYPASAHRF
jgi:hypothetical protein